MALRRNAPALPVAAFLVAIAVVHLAGANVVSKPGPAPQEVEDRFILEPRGVRITDWVTGLEAPWSLAFLPDGRALVSERAGRIRLIEDGRLIAAPVADLSAVQGIEGGLMGLAVHPRFPSRPFVYAMLTTEVAARPRNRVVRLRLEGRHAVFDRVIIDRIPAGRGHNGGRIGFGPDGMLYVGTGDVYEPGLAQDRTNLAGKILRATPEGRPAPGNPWRRSPVYSMGHRNVQGLAWHPLTGDLFASEHGPTGEGGVIAHDEINLIRPGENFGWPLVVGAPGTPGLADPLVAWTGRPTPPSGMAFWRGDLYLATLGSQSLVRIGLEPLPHGYRVHAIERWFNDGEDPVGRHSRLRDAVVGPDDALYVLTNKLDAGGDPADGDDRILRIESCMEIRQAGGARGPSDDPDDADCRRVVSRVASAATGRSRSR